MGEIKQANFRVDTEAADKFRTFCETQGFNQAQGFDHLMDVLSLNNAKETIPGRLTEIEDVEYHVKAILSAYLNSLQLAQDSEARAKEQFQTLITSKDQSIIQLQSVSDDLKEKYAGLEIQLKAAEEKRLAAEKMAIEAKEKEEAAVKTALDKAAINEMLNAKLVEAEEKLKGYSELLQSEIALKNELLEIKQLIEVDNERHEKEKEKALAESERMKMKELKELYDKITMLQDEKSLLKEQINDLKLSAASQSKTRTTAKSKAND